MYQRTTPTLLFTIPFTQAQIAKLRLTLEQGTTSLTFTEADVTFNDNIVSLVLTQEQTAKFIPKADVAIQMRIKRADCDEVSSSQIVKTDIFRTLNKEVL